MDRMLASEAGDTGSIPVESATLHFPSFRSVRQMASSNHIAEFGRPKLGSKVPFL